MSAKNKQFLKQRRVARLAENPREGARHDCPNQTEFGVAEYVDDDGREYRVAYLEQHEWVPGEAIPPRSLLDRVNDRADSRGAVKLWMRRKRGKASTVLVSTDQLHLRPNRPGLTEQWVTVDAHEQTRAVQRTTNVYVFGLR